VTRCSTQTRASQLELIVVWWEGGEGEWRSEEELCGVAVLKLGPLSWGRSSDHTRASQLGMQQ
jgi:hypothetical protein